MPASRPAPASPKPNKKSAGERPPAPNVRLDPHGLAGTGTARRLRLARRRRHLQWFLAAIAAVAFVGLLLAYLLRPGLPPLALREVQHTSLIDATAATIAPNGQWLVATREGELWRVTPSAQNVSAALVTQSDFPASAPPLVAQGKVFYATLDGSLNAYDEKTSRFLWHFGGGESISTTPALWRKTSQSRAVLAVGNDAGLVTGLDANTGQQLWAVGVGGPSGQAITATRDAFVVSMLPGKGSRGGLVALDPNSGKRRWRLPQNARFYAASIGAPLFAAKSNYLYWATDDGAVFCINASNGVPKWKTFAPPLASSPKGAAVVLRGKPLLFENQLFVGGEDGGLRAFNAETGQLLWTTSFDGAIEQAPTVLEAVGGVRLMVVAGNQFALVDPKNGSIGAIAATKIVAWDGKNKLVLDRDGVVFRLEP